MPSTLDVVDKVKRVMSEDFISDDEVLYRRVPDDKRLLKRLSNGTIKISSQAFYESGFRPSVDRAKKCENDPWRTANRYTGPCGVTSIIATDVRAINLVQHDRSFIVDIEPKPIFNDPNEPDNPAHAEIYTDPMCSRKVFQKLLERLALLANSRSWEIEPPSLKSES